MFQSKSFKVIAFSLFFVLAICLTSLINSWRCHISVGKSTDENAPISISPGEEIEISVLRSREDRLFMKVYWDDKDDDCVKLSCGFFISKGTILAPTEKGEHVLVIKYSYLISKQFYYVVE